MNKIFEKLAVKKDAYASNQVIVNAGKESDDMHYITDGFVQVYDLSSDGTIKTILILKQGDIFPLIWGFDQPGEIVYYYKAMAPTHTYKASGNLMREELKKDAEVSQRAMLQFVYLTWDLMERVKCLQMSYTYEKLTRMLPYLVAKIGTRLPGDGNSYKLDFKVTQHEMAQLIGVTRESMSQYIRRIEKEGIITRSRAAMHVNLDKLPSEYIFRRWFDHADKYKI